MRAHVVAALLLLSLLAHSGAVAVEAHPSPNNTSDEALLLQFDRAVLAQTPATAIPAVTGGTLFAVTSSTHCAEALPYGPQPSQWAQDNAVPFFCNSCDMKGEDEWLQIFMVGSTERFRIKWKFTSGPKTLADRFHYAASTGEPVTWTVTVPDGTEHTLQGTWRFSNSYDNGARGGFKTGSGGSHFTPDDGMWVAAIGTVDGNHPGPSGTASGWGQGNYDSSDYQCQFLYEAGVKTTHADLHTFLYAMADQCTAGANGQPCQNGGTVTGTTGQCACSCASGYSGANCEKVMEKYAEHNLAEPCEKPYRLPWPRPRFCHPANKRVCAPKRGLSIDRKLYSETGEVCKFLKLFSSLQPWWFNADVGTCSLCNAAGDDYDGCTFNYDSGFVPMVGTLNSLTHPALPADALLGFYKPEYDQQRLVGDAVNDWKKIEKKAADVMIEIPRIGSPAVKGTAKGFAWLDEFFNLCNKNCKVDFITARIYAMKVAGPGGSLQEVLAAYTARYGLTVWLVEFNFGGKFANATTADHFNFMKEALPLLETSHDVERYAWDSLCNAEVPGASLADCGTNELTDLGIFYRDYNLVTHDPAYSLPEWNSDNMRLSAAA